MSRQISLTQGKYALVDDEDFDYLNQWKWSLKNGRYACRKYCLGGGSRKDRREVLVVMHRLLTNAPKGMDVDHINGDGLDNRRSNLRVCTHHQNCLNNKLSRRNKSGHKGVYERYGRWRALIQYNGKLHHLGVFDSKQEAINVRLEAEKLYFREYARITNA